MRRKFGGARKRLDGISRAMSGPTREERLKAALRENLKRRKAQARSRAGKARDGEGPSRDEPGADEAERS